MPTLHQINEERCLIPLGWCLRTSVWGERYLTHLPVLAVPVSEKSFLIYVRAMDHSLEALLARIMIRGTSKQSTTWVEPWSELNTDTILPRKNAWHWYSLFRRCDTTWWAKHTCHIKSQSFKIAYDKAIIVEWSIGKIGHVSLPIWDAIPATKGCEVTGSGRFSY